MNGAPVLDGVTAIDAAPSKIDAHITLFEIGDPAARRHTIPSNDAPGSRMRTTAQDSQRVPFRMKVARQNLSNLTAASWYHDSHDGRYLRHAADSAICFTTAFLSRSSACIYRRRTAISANRPRSGSGAANRN